MKNWNLLFFCFFLVVKKIWPDNGQIESNFWNSKKTKKFDGIKEDVYLSDFEPDKNFHGELENLGIQAENILLVVRPHAPEALYHRGFANKILDELLDKFAACENVKIILLPRKKYQGEDLKKRHAQSNIIVPENVLDGANLLASADFVISGGGTMNREAAALGIPTATIFVGHAAAISGGALRAASTQPATIRAVPATVISVNASPKNHQPVSDAQMKAVYSTLSSVWASARA